VSTEFISDVENNVWKVFARSFNFQNMNVLSWVTVKRSDEKKTRIAAISVIDQMTF